MLPLDDLLDVADGDFDVLGGGVDLAVAEDLLHMGDVGASLEKVRRAGMAERVRMEPGDAASGRRLGLGPVTHAFRGILAPCVLGARQE